MSKKIRIRVIPGVIALILIAAIIAGNIALSSFSYVINQALAGDTTDYSGASAELEAGDEVVQALGEESMVLLKNEEDFLPLDTTQKVNLFGWAATDQGFLLVGGGSGGTVIAAENKITLTAALAQEGIEYNQELLDAYSAISSADADANSNSPDSMAALANPDESFYTAERMSQAKEYSDTAIVVLSRFSGENASQTELIDIGSYSNGTFLELTANEKAMLDALEENQFRVIVLFNTTNNMEMGFLEEYDCIKAALYVGLPGQSGALAIPRILYGDVNPSGRTADTLAYDYQTNNPTYVNGRYVNNSMVYQEGIYVGYKWYETADEVGFFDGVTNDYGTCYDAVVQYPFGYGLSYTDFEWTAQASWSASDEMAAGSQYTVEVTVSNTGDVAGRDVVQLYYTPPYTEGGIEMASVNLLAFAKTDLIEPGESQTVTLTFDAYDLASYDYNDANGNQFTGYETVSGDYAIRLMRNSHTDGVMAENGESAFVLHSSGITFAKDPDTDADVGNLFTGDTAYADTPIDGSTMIPGGVDYLSRADGFANYPTAGANPNDKNTWLTEQALRETYLKPFEMCVKDGGANGIMSAFNRVGAVWAGSNHALITQLLRGEWGFRGTVITDWYQPGYMDYTRGAKAGNNLWLDGTFDRAAEIDLSDPGTAYAARQAVKNILYTYVVTTTAVSITDIPQSTLFIALWVALDVILVAGVGVCVFFMVKPSKKKEK